MAAESWDTDPDLVLPDGPLLLGSDTEGDTSASSLAGSTLFSAPGDDDGMDWDAELPGDSPLGLSSSRIAEEPDGEHSLDLDDLDSSRSSVSDDEKQATLKAHNQKQHSMHGINAAVLAVLASGAKGTVTKLEPARKVQSPELAGLDWDEDLELPAVGLQNLSISSHRLLKALSPAPAIDSNDATLRLKPKSSWASGISDEFDLTDFDDDATKTLSSPKRLPHPPPSKSLHGPSPQQLRARRSTREPAPPPEDVASDFDLPLSLSCVSLSPSLARPKSLVSLSGSESDTDMQIAGLGDSLGSLVPPPTSNRSGLAKMGGLPSTAASSFASLRDEDLLNRARGRSNSALSRPSLTPSLTTDRSSSSFTEGDLFDEDDGFFDDIEIPPDFGAQAVEESITCGRPLVDAKGKGPAKIDLQAWLEYKVRTRCDSQGEQPTGSVSSTSSSHSGTVAPSPQPRPGSSASLMSASTIQGSRFPKRNPIGFEERDDERPEDGLEIDVMSLRPDRLRPQGRVRTNSGVPKPTGVIRGGSAVRNQAGQHPRKAVVPFPSPPIPKHKLVVPVLGRTSSLGHVENSNHFEARTMPRSVSSNVLGKRPTTMYGSQTPESLAKPNLSSQGSVRHRTVSLKVGQIAPMLSSSRPAPSVQPRLSAGTLSRHTRNAPTPVERPPTAPGVRSPSRASAGSSNGGLFPPTLSVPKRKQSSNNLRSTPTPTTTKPTTPGAVSDTRAKGLTRKQSMPSLSDNSSVASCSSGPSATRHLTGRVTSGTNGTSSPTPSFQTLRSRYQPPKPLSAIAGIIPPADQPHRQVNRTLLTGSPLPSPTLSQTPTLPRAKTPSRSSGPPSVKSHFSLPTISTRLKAKPPAPPDDARLGHKNSYALSLTHGIPRSRSSSSASTAFSTNPGPSSHTGNALSIAVPQPLKRPKRPRQYGDGSELDGFDDLPTSKEKEKLFVTKPIMKRSWSSSTAPSPTTTITPSTSATTVKVQPPATSTSESKGSGKPSDTLKRLQIRKAEQARKRAESMAKAKGPTKRGLIRQMSMNTMVKAVNGMMKWNSSESRWDGNDQVLRDFDNVLSSSSRPALISQFSSAHSPSAKVVGSSSSVQVVGDMVFDPIAMCWHSRAPEGEDELDFGDDKMDNLSFSTTNSSLGVGVGGAGRMSLGSKMIETQSWDTGGLASETTMRLSKRTSWIGESSGSKSNSNSMDIDDDGCIGIEIDNDEATAFWRKCVGAELRHNEEMKSWGETLGMGEVDRSYLSEIRKLVLEQ